MKRYSVHEYPLRGFFSGMLYNRIHGVYTHKNGKGGLIVFPEDMTFVDNTVPEGMRSEGSYFTGRTVSKDGTAFSDMSICIDVRDMPSGHMMSLAMKYSRMYHRTVLLKDCDGKRVYSVKFNEVIDMREHLAA